MPRNADNIDKVLKKLKKELDKIVKDNNYRIEAGWYTDFFVMLANVHEYGAFVKVTDKMRGFLMKNYGIFLPKSKTQIVIPPRPHRQTTIDKYIDKWRRELNTLLDRPNIKVEQACEIMAMTMQQDYKYSIMNNNLKSLAGMTLHIRKIKGIGGTLPLFATGEFVRNIEGKVEKNE